jgi:glycosyltransferase involved in cell wall biosynthesis
MARILVNASNVVGAGARALALSLLPALFRIPGHRYSALLPDRPEFCALDLPPATRADFASRPSGPANSLLRLRELYWDVAALARRDEADCCLTLGDFAAVGLRCPQVVFLQQPLVLYGVREVGGAPSWSRLKRLYFRQHLAYTAHKVDRFIVQTPVMAARLAGQFPVPAARVHVISQPVPLHVTAGCAGDTHPAIASCARPLRLLFLAAGYPHKNHAVLGPLLGELSRRGISHLVHFYLTLDPGEISPALAAMLRDHGDMITNLGRLALEQVAGALRAATALFLPTLVESYGLTYVEALACGIPILTSDRDFARWMCGDLALYFDPLDAGSIVDAIARLAQGPARSADFERRAAVRLAEFPADWAAVAQAMLNVVLAAQ